MNIKLVDVDNKYREKKRRGKIFPNLALMKISAYHKANGDTVLLDRSQPGTWDFKNWASRTVPDLTYISCVFEKNAMSAKIECAKVHNGISFGGSGINLEYELPDSINNMKPDYDLYPSEYSMGFTTRGCIRKCPFCIVHKKEPKFKRVGQIKDFHDSRFKSCKILDNNILADKDWFFENTNWAIENKVQLDITQGMDIRLLTDEISDQLKRIKFVDQQMRFAWDTEGMEDKVFAGIEMLRDHKINVRRNVSFYVICGIKIVDGVCVKNSLSAFDLYRVNKLRNNGVMAFVMKYHDDDKALNHLARWSDKRRIYWKTPFSDYLESKTNKRKQEPRP